MLGQCQQEMRDGGTMFGQVADEGCLRSTKGARDQTRHKIRVQGLDFRVRVRAHTVNYLKPHLVEATWGGKGCEGCRG